ncbi:MAG: hypothetical protein ACRDZO_15595 [Egibacteraceae bacterium]
MDHGLGIAEQLRRVGHRFAQGALHHYLYLDHHPFEFTSNAGLTVEFLAKAIVAADKPDKIFEKPLTESERDVLAAPSAGRRRLTGDETKRARESLAAKHTIKARPALDEARKLVEDRGITLDTEGAKRLLQARNAVLHLGDKPIEPIEDLARIFVPLAEQLWAALARDPTELWGDLAEAVAGVGKDWDYPHWDATRRIAQARNRWSELGVTAMNRRSHLVGRSADARCPACGFDAHRSIQPPGSAPEGLVTRPSGPTSRCACSTASPVASSSTGRISSVQRACPLPIRLPASSRREVGWTSDAVA